jgi:hypothetical protein
MENKVMYQGGFMRLYNIYFLCKKNIDLIKDFQLPPSKDGNGRDIFKFNNWKQVKNILNELYTVNGLEDSVRKVYESLDPITRDAAIPIISTGVKNTLVNNQTTLIEKMQTIIELYESMGNGVSGTGIDVKLPKCSGLKEYINYLKEIDFVFTQCPFLRSKDEAIVFNTVDVGSIWLTFAIVAGTSFYILNNLAGLMKQAVAIKSNILTYKQQEEQLHAMRNKNEISDEVIQTFKKLKDDILKDAVHALEDKESPLADGEEIDKAAKSIEKLILLMDKGVEIQSSIETPAEVKILFPMQETQPLLIEDIIKLLEMKKE